VPYESESILVAHSSATTEGSLARSDGDLSRTDVPSSQYNLYVKNNYCLSLIFLFCGEVKNCQIV